MKIYHIIRIQDNELTIKSYYSFSRLKKENHDVEHINKSSLPVTIESYNNNIMIVEGDLNQMV